MMDLAIIGSGFGGTLMAMVARSFGLSVVLLEKSSHPRFVIGESSTPLADLLWLELTQAHGLTSLAPFAKWGTWRRAHPEVACGLKRGFTFYGHKAGEPFAAAEDRSDQLLVGASPRDEVADTHWFREEFDHFLVREAQRLGVDYFDHCDVQEVSVGTGGARISARHNGGVREFQSRFVIDASNQRGPLSRSLGLAELPLPHLPPTQGLYTHFRNVARLGQLPLHPGIEKAPFPVDDAAVHHVFEGGWIWVLRFVNGVTSAGVAATDAAATRLGLHEGAAGWERLLGELPTVARQFAKAETVQPWVYAPRLSFRTGPAAGPGWALLPSAAGFVDPLLSSGFTLTLLGIERLAAALRDHWKSPDGLTAALGSYAVETTADMLALEKFIAALYARLGDFPAFTEIARLYFCAVIHCETTRRLGRPGDSGGFLMRNHPEFAADANACCDAAIAGEPTPSLRARVDALLKKFDLGGLEDETRRPWYPVMADDLRRCRGRVGASESEVESLLRRSGLVPG